MEAGHGEGEEPQFAKEASFGVEAQVKAGRTEKNEHTQHIEAARLAVDGRKVLQQ